MDTKPTKQRFLLVRTLSVVLVLVLLLIWISIPNFVRSGAGRLTRIIITLQQIDAAKQQWAYEHGITNTIQCTNHLTETDMERYLGGKEDRIDRPEYLFDRSGRPRSAFGEKYIINPLKLPPEAQLTRDFKVGRGSTFSLPKDTIIRLSSSGYEILLPDVSTIAR
jgi:hypothetical protein